MNQIVDFNHSIKIADILFMYIKSHHIPSIKYNKSYVNLDMQHLKTMYHQIKDFSSIFTILISCKYWLSFSARKINLPYEYLTPILG